jgi:hypothetical protein
MPSVARSAEDWPRTVVDAVKAPELAVLPAIGRGCAFGIWNYFNRAVNLLALRATAGWLYPELMGQRDLAETLEAINRRFAAMPLGGFPDICLKSSRAGARCCHDRAERSCWPPMLSPADLSAWALCCCRRVAAPCSGHGRVKEGCYTRHR